MSLRLGALKRAEEKISSDVLILGGGPAAFGAALYSARYRLNAVVVAESIGGQLNNAGEIENYLGFERIQASELVGRFKKHVESYGVKVLQDRVIEVKREGEGFIATTRRGTKIDAKAVIVAIGLKRRVLGVPGEREFVGRGVSYCSICDAAFFKDAEAVAVVGGGDSAMEGASLLSNFAKKVYLIHRRGEFRAQPILVEEVKSKGNVEIVLDTVVTEIMGTKSVEGIKVRNLKTGEERELRVSGVFIEIGFEPDTQFIKSLGLETDDYGFIKVHGYMETNVKGMFAAGDITDLWRGFRQVVTSVAQGAVAAHGAYRYIEGMKLKKTPGSTGQS
ncbi:MAG: FAD-dependent oxidoreductase [Thermoprotei archaeon]|nr:FAD-dependent oxidoreductase [Thermoprotei archaeon]